MAAGALSADALSSSEVVVELSACALATSSLCGAVPAGRGLGLDLGPVARLTLRGRCLEVSVPWRGRLALDLGGFISAVSGSCSSTVSASEPDRGWCRSASLANDAPVLCGAMKSPSSRRARPPRRPRRRCGAAPCRQAARPDWRLAPRPPRPPRRSRARHARAPDGDRRTRMCRRAFRFSVGAATTATTTATPLLRALAIGRRTVLALLACLAIGLDGPVRQLVLVDPRWRKRGLTPAVSKLAASERGAIGSPSSPRRNRRRCACRRPRNSRRRRSDPRSGANGGASG